MEKHKDETQGWNIADREKIYTLTMRHMKPFSCLSSIMQATRQISLFHPCPPRQSINQSINQNFLFGREEYVPEAKIFSPRKACITI